MESKSDKRLYLKGDLCCLGSLKQGVIVRNFSRERPECPPAFHDLPLWTSKFTFPFNATGQPAFSLPNGFSKAGLPIGLQIVGRQNDEAGIIALAAQFEEACPWKDKHPPVD